MVKLEIETRQNALLAIEGRRMYPGMTKRQVLEAVLKKAQEEGWVDVIVQCQRANSRDNAATKG